jgi:ubiquinone/menaquinone biosynthesis C-methylase UbiE
MFSKKGILAALTLAVIVLTLYVAPTVWGQEKPRDTEGLLRAMQVDPGDWVADVGIGEGDYTLPMAQAVGDSGRAFAVDIDEDALEELNDEIKDRDVNNVTVVSSVYDNPMLPRRSFDAVLVRNAYHEFTAHQAMLRHLRTALKPGGRLVMAEYIGDGMAEEDRDEQVEEHELALRYARREVRRAGFQVVEEVDTLRYSEEYDRRFWMMVATRPPVDRGS